MTKKLKELPAGKYWVGDLCYVLDEDKGFDWGEFCEWMFDGDESGREHEGPHLYKDIHLSYHGTAYGDGCYPDGYGRSYGVDAGMIGCVKASDIELDMEEEGEFNGGYIIIFDKPFTTSYNNGTINIGSIAIETGDDYEDTEEEVCEECGMEEQYHDGLCKDCLRERRK